jgi:hypothetical protein
MVFRKNSLRKQSLLRAPRGDLKQPTWFRKLVAQTSLYERLDLVLTFAGWSVSILVLWLGVKQVYLLEDESRRQTKSLETQVRQVGLLDEENKRQTLFLEAQVWRSVGEEGARINSLIVTYPDVRPYFEDKWRISRRNRNYARVMAIAEMKLDFIDSFDDEYVRSLRGMQDNGKYWVLWQKYFYGMFESSPALCIRYSELKDTYTPGVGVYARKCAALQVAGPASKGK